MVLRQREAIMSSEQPLKKRPKRENIPNDTDETDFIQNFNENGVQSNLQALHLSLPSTINEQDLDYTKTSYLINSDSDLDKSVSESNDSELTTQSERSNLSIPLAPDIVPYSEAGSSNNESGGALQLVQDLTLNEFQQGLVKQCLCTVMETIVCKPLEEQEASTRNINLMEWPYPKILQFLSNVQLLLNVYLKQNNKGFVCSKIVTNCDILLCNQYNLIEQIISLCETRNQFVHYLAARVLSSFLITAKTEINNEWLETILSHLTTESPNYAKLNFSLEIIKRVVEWKDVDIHVLEENDVQDGAVHNPECVMLSFKDSETYDTSNIKGLIIKSLESKWPELINKIQVMISNNTSMETQTCILTFFTLWERIISVKANLSVIDIKPFYTHFEIFVSMLNNSLPPIIWKQLLSLFNEVLCYGSTLALQDMIPDDTCQLAHLIVKFVKDYRLLDSVPFRWEPGNIINSFVGVLPNMEPTELAIDRTLLQKMVLLVLKSVAVTIKETRSDSSDSSVGSDDYDFYQDMQLIERSIRDVLRKVDNFVKNALDFLPETPFCKTLVHLFSDQDNYLIESMVCTLDIAVGISYRNAVFPDLAAMINPTHSFTEFLKLVHYDSAVLLDYLVGSETCFLLYLLRFLKYARRNWDKFVSSCAEGNTSRINELDKTMEVLTRLNSQINRLVSRDLFPYNINPILRLLTVCENLYNGNEYS